jgi:hypothetical protein
MGHMAVANEKGPYYQSITLFIFISAPPSGLEPETL